MNRDPNPARTLQVGDSHQVDIPMRWGDSDALNHMNNTVYFRMIEEARVHLLRGAGLGLPAEHGFILAHASCDFLRAFTYPCSVRVTHRVARIGRASLEAELVLDKAGDDTGPYARGRSVLVWMDYTTHQSRPLPAAALARLAAQCVPAARSR